LNWLNKVHCPYLDFMELRLTPTMESLDMRIPDIIPNFNFLFFSNHQENSTNILGELGHDILKDTKAI
jgi:hypothetical protein